MALALYICLSNFMQAYCVVKYPSSFGWWVKPRVQAIALCTESGVGQEEHSRAQQDRLSLED